MDRLKRYGWSWMAFFGWRRMSRTRQYDMPDPVPNPTPTPPPSFPVFVVSHRSGSLEKVNGVLVIENTQPAIENCIKLGADLVELDVHMSKDGKIVVFHDDDMGLWCGPEYKGKAVADLDASELPPIIRLADPENPDSYKLVPKEQGLRILLLEEVFQKYPTLKIVLDVRPKTPGLAAALNKVISDNKKEKQVVWGSAKHSVSNELYKANPSIPLWADEKRAAYIVLAHDCGRLDKVHIYESLFILPYQWPVALSKKWNFVVPLLNPPLFKALQDKGIPCVVDLHRCVQHSYGYCNTACVNTAIIEACINSGAKGVLSDVPGLVQEIMKSKGML